MDVAQGLRGANHRAPDLGYPLALGQAVLGTRINRGIGEPDGTRSWSAALTRAPEQSIARGDEAGRRLAAQSRARNPPVPLPRSSDGRRTRRLDPSAIPDRTKFTNTRQDRIPQREGIEIASLGRVTILYVDLPAMDRFELTRKMCDTDAAFGNAHRAHRLANRVQPKAPSIGGSCTPREAYRQCGRALHSGDSRGPNAALRALIPALGAVDATIHQLVAAWRVSPGKSRCWLPSAVWNSSRSSPDSSA